MASAMAKVEMTGIRQRRVGTHIPNASIFSLQTQIRLRKQLSKQ